MNEEHYDVAVVGGGLGGIYAASRFRDSGLSVIGIDGGSDFGGVWYHNAYPGARVDTDSITYSYKFSAEIYSGWQWSERYAQQPELMAYLHWVAEQLDVRPLFRFDTWVQDAEWSGADDRWHIATDTGLHVAARFLVMCTGNLSEPKPVDFPGLDRFEGEWHQTNRWPHHDVPLAGRRIAVVGTGSSGIQVVPVAAAVAEQLYVFQRTPHYVIPAQNRGPETEAQAEIAARLDEHREEQLARPTLPRGRDSMAPLSEYSPADRVRMLEAQWEYGGHGMSYVFSDIGTNLETNEFVAEFVRDKIRAMVHDPELAEKFMPDYPIGTRRLCIDIGYYDSFNRENVELVDMRETPICEITATGIRTTDALYEVDLIIFGLGFKPFLGAMDRAGIRNERGQTPRDVWARGPRTLFGLMTPGFPNLFHPTNAGSPSTLGPLFLQNEYHADWIADCIAHMERHGYRVVEATEAGADVWGAKSAAVSERMIRRQVDNYMVHVNADDGSRAFQPWGAGMATYVPEVRAMTANDYEGMAFH